jgi:hypothetical protein
LKVDSEERERSLKVKEKGVPEWEEYPHTPGVFVRVANKGDTGYGTWKSVRKMGDGEKSEKKTWFEGGDPAFCVRAESKGVTRITVL